MDTKVKQFVFFGILITLLMSTSYEFKKVVISSSNIENKDTVIISKPLSNELAGGNYRRGGKIYFPVVNKDTLGFRCYLSESKSGKLSLEYRRFDYKSSHRKNLRFLALMLPKMTQDFNLDSLSSIYLGRLVSHGDLAIQVTKQYHQKFGKSTKIGKYSTVFNFLTSSQIGTDFNKLFESYQLKVKLVSAEKIFFASRTECLRYSKIETDSTIIPAKILDGMTYVKLEKKL
jgi:hypothetical protein